MPDSDKDIIRQTLNRLAGFADMPLPSDPNNKKKQKTGKSSSGKLLISIIQRPDVKDASKMVFAKSSASTRQTESRQSIQQLPVLKHAAFFQELTPNIINITSEFKTFDQVIEFLYENQSNDNGKHPGVMSRLFFQCVTLDNVEVKNSELYASFCNNEFVWLFN